VPVAESAGALQELVAEGKTRSVGVSNFTVAELQQFAAVCPIAACQPLFNLLQQDVRRDILPWCLAHGVSVLAYEPLAKGLLTGKFRADHAFAESDWRRRSPLFQSPAWEQNLALVERLRALADRRGSTVAQLAIAWTLGQPGITAALCGAKQPGQIVETAAAADRPLSAAETDAIAALLAGPKPAPT
jgi:aryl-alcohol dehydrogenase-like predicted oxidoreductase